MKENPAALFYSRVFFQVLCPSYSYVQIGESKMTTSRKSPFVILHNNDVKTCHFLKNYVQQGVFDKPESSRHLPLERTKLGSNMKLASPGSVHNYKLAFIPVYLYWRFLPWTSCQVLRCVQAQQCLPVHPLQSRRRSFPVHLSVEQTRTAPLHVECRADRSTPTVCPFGTEQAGDQCGAADLSPTRTSLLSLQAAHPVPGHNLSLPVHSPICLSFPPPSHRPVKHQLILHVGSNSVHGTSTQERHDMLLLTGLPSLGIAWHQPFSCSR